MMGLKICFNGENNMGNYNTPKLSLLSRVIWSTVNKMFLLSGDE